MNKQHIDEFEKEFPPGDVIRFYPEVNEYRMKPASMAANPCEADIEAGKQNARLEVWLKQREKMEAVNARVRTAALHIRNSYKDEAYVDPNINIALRLLEAADD